MKKMTRRAFISTGVLAGGGLVVGVAIRPGHRAPDLKKLVVKGDETLVNAWVKITPDNKVVAIVPHCEMGQGVHTSLPMMLAEELDADWDSVSVLEAPADEEYANYALARGFIMGDIDVPDALVGSVNGAFLKITQAIKLQITGGSTSVKTTGRLAMQTAGAAAREMLIDAAAELWKLPSAELTSKHNFVHHTNSKKKISYAKLAPIAAEMTPSYTPKLKSPGDYKIIGQSPKRLDIAGKINGQTPFGIDIQLDNLVYAAIKRSPVFGAQLKSVDSSAVDAAQGLVKIVKLENAVSVVATSYWLAQKLLDQLNIRWQKTDNDETSTKTIFTAFDEAIGNGEATEDFSVGNTKAAKKDVHQSITAEYQLPYLAHATMEPLNCTAHHSGGKCYVWTGSQNPLGFKSDIADALDMDMEQVVFKNLSLGGGFGRRSNSDYAVQAALIAQQIDRPVKLIWSREEDTKQDHYRQASISRFEGGLDQDGLPLYWENRFVDKHEPVEAPYPPYDIPNQLIEFVNSPTHIPFGPWRSVDHSLHAFCTESFVDELAHRAGQDPLKYRVKLLSNNKRLSRVLEEVASISNWDKPLGENQGKGVSIHQSFGSVVAQVAYVSVVDNQLSVDKVFCVVDVGTAIYPDGLIVQMESGIIYGLTAALYGKIEIENGSVKQGNFDTYPMLRIDKSPEIKVKIVKSDTPLGGAGEPGTPPIFAAVTNAVFSATNKRIRKLPVSEFLNC